MLDCIDWASRHGISRDMPIAEWADAMDRALGVKHLPNDHPEQSAARWLAAIEAKPARMTKAADDYDTIRQRLAELQLEKRRCTGGCGEPIRGYHKEGCKHAGVVVEGETE